MTIIFKAKTNCAFTIKILAELLQNNIKTACFEVDRDGIKLSMMDDHSSVLIKLSMNSDNFSVYKFKPSNKLYLGINLNHFHRMLKSIKKKDSIQLFINDDNPSDLGIKVIPKENNRITTSFIKIQEKQNTIFEAPTGYDKPVIVSSTEYQKMCKDMSHIGNTIHVTSKNFHIKFICDAGGVIKRHVEFGELENSDEDDDDDEDHIEEYNDDFNTEQLSKITKMSGLSSNIQIYPKKGKPLLFKSGIGSLGYIYIYIKSKAQCVKQNNSSEEEEF